MGKVYPGDVEIVKSRRLTFRVSKVCNAHAHDMTGYKRRKDGSAQPEARTSDGGATGCSFRLSSSIARRRTATRAGRGHGRSGRTRGESRDCRAGRRRRSRRHCARDLRTKAASAPVRKRAAWARAFARANRVVQVRVHHAWLARSRQMFTPLHPSEGDG